MCKTKHILHVCIFCMYMYSICINARCKETLSHQPALTQAKRH